MPWTADLEITVDLVAARISTEFAHFAGASIQSLGEGWDNAAFLIGGEYVFRFPRRAAAVPLMAREIAILPKLAPELPLPISAPSFVGKETDAYPWPYAGYRSFRGQPLSAAPLDAAAYPRIAAALGTFLRALHSIDPARAISGGLPVDEIGRLDHAQRMPKLRERFAALTACGLAVEPAAFLDFLEGVAPQGPRADRLCVVHGDLYCKHVFVHEDAEVEGIIDWGDVHLGDPALDISVLFELMPAQARSAFVQAYGRIDERTLELAHYRAIYHAALVAYYGYRIGDEETLRAGLTGLKYAAP